MLNNFLKNYLSTVFLIIITYIFYTTNSYFHNFFTNNYSFAFNNFSITSLGSFDSFSLKGFLVDPSWEYFKQNFLSKLGILNYFVIIYSLVLIPYYLVYKNKSKARVAMLAIYNFLFNGQKIDKKEKTAILAWAVKIFFAPLMIYWLSGHIFTMTNNFYYSYQDINLATTDFLSFFNKHFFWLAFTTILFVDVFFFTMGYIVEIPKLKNMIKSVEPTAFGWIVALACYPPFNTITTKIIGWNSTDFPQFENPYTHLIVGFLVLILMALYSSASFSLGFKASNLTNRGIVSSGLYSIVRHPAYISKNLAWWFGGLSYIYIALAKDNYKEIFLIILSLSAWSFIYYLRAVTEERHLSADPDYIKYKKQVKYKFIPGVW